MRHNVAISSLIILEEELIIRLHYLKIVDSLQELSNGLHDEYIGEYSAKYPEPTVAEIHQDVQDTRLQIVIPCVLIHLTSSFGLSLHLIGSLHLEQVK